MRSFCCNPKCQWHGTPVKDSTTEVVLAQQVNSYATLESYFTQHAVVNQLVVRRHLVVMRVGGVDMEDFLCYVCYEVVRIFGD